METQVHMTGKQKAAKIASYIINVLSIIIMIFALFIVITSLTSKDRGYTAYFNKAYVVVKSNSMAKDLSKPDNFKEGDVIAFTLLTDEQKETLEVGTVVTFWDNYISSTRELNTHRIVAVRDGEDGHKEYSTHGDNNPDEFDRDNNGNQLWRKASDMQGVYAGKSTVVGQVLTYLQSRTGFAIFIVAPCVLIMIYCIVLVVLNLMRYTRAKTVIQHEDNVDALKAELKEQLLKEMAEEKKKEEQSSAESENKEENKDATEKGETEEKNENVEIEADNMQEDNNANDAVWDKKPKQKKNKK